MRFRVTLVDHERSRDVVVETEPGGTLAELLAATSGAAPRWHGALANGRALPLDARLGERPLVDGAVLTNADSRPAATSSTHGDRALIEVVVASGPDAGTVHRLAAGRHRIGRSPDAEVVLEDAEVSRIHALIEVSSSGVHLADLGSTNGTLVDGRRVGPGGRVVQAGDLLVVGGSRLRLRPPASASATPGDDAPLVVRRPPRIRSRDAATVLRVPRPPEPPPPRPFPWAALLVPLPLAGVLAATMGPRLLLVGLTGPLLVMANLLGDRRSGARARRQAVAGYAAQLTDARADLDDALARERRARMTEHPDLVELLDIAAGPGPRLWERRGPEVAELELRVGTGSVPSALRVALDPGQSDVPVLVHEVPVCLRLGEVGALGITGSPTARSGAARSLLCRLATTFSPQDLAIWVVRTPGASSTWDWVGWLPHHRSDLTDPTSLRRAELDPDQGTPDPVLDALVRDRAHSGDDAGTGGVRHVVLLDGTAASAHPVVTRLTGRGARAGVHVIALAPTSADLPGACSAVLGMPDTGPGVLEVADADPHRGIVVDRVSAAWAERLARTLSPLRDVPTATGVPDLPGHARLAEVLGVDPGDPAAVTRHWRSERRAGPTAVLGIGQDGPFTLDLVRDGPHVLVGGTTGSGKSELLQTFVTSLAISSPPDEVSFVLVDYKGGSAFTECARLPHTVGVVTDLDTRLTARALASLRAELRRRERLLHAVGATDLDDYRRDRDRDPISRLVIVIDEFRALADELPEFLDGLVRVGSTGRSLGIHLALATQRPAGVVSADLRANVNTRIALRMHDRADSQDVVDGPEAAAIPESSPGRAVARVGGRPLETFQVARVRVAAPAERAHRVTVDPVPRCRRDGCAGPTHDAPGPSGATDLTRFVQTIATAAAGMDEPHVPWLPPLPDVVRSADLASGDRPAVVWGVVDRPDGQCREPLVWDPTEGVHWAVAGGPRSGRTTAVRTLAALAAGALPPERLHVYAVDGSGTLSGLAALPHTGAVVPTDDAPRLARLLERLGSEVARRRARLAELGHADVTAWEAAEGAAPAILLLLVDGWEHVLRAGDTAEHGPLLESLLTLAGEGGPAGLRLVATGDRSLLLGRASGVFRQRLALPLADPTDAAVLGLPRTLDGRRPPGRAVQLPEGWEAQIAVLGDDPTPSGQAQALDTLAADLDASADRSAHGSATRPFRIDPLPTRVMLTDIDHPPGPDVLTLGLGRDDGRSAAIDLTQDGRHILVCGPAGTGRTTALATVARSALARNRPVAIVAAGPLDGHLQALRGSAGVTTVVIAGADDTRADALAEAHRRHAGLVVVVDDADRLVDGAVEAVLRRLAPEIERGDGALVVGSTTAQVAVQYRGLAVEVARRRTGVLLCPRTGVDGGVLGVDRLPVTAPLPGRGVLVRRGRTLELQVAVPGPITPRSS